VANAVLATIYFVAGKLGLTMADVQTGATAVWPGTLNQNHSILLKNFIPILICRDTRP
jgi:hypothetical protein